VEEAAALPLESADRAPEPAPYALRVASLAVLWLAVVALSLGFRAFLALWFRARLGPGADAAALEHLFVTGVRSDVLVATWAVLPALLVTLLGGAFALGAWPARVRRATAALVLCGCALVFAVDAAYFAEYGAQFNDWIFGVVYDDRAAILGTIWKTYPVVLLLGIAAAGAWVALAAVGRAGRAAARASERLPVPRRTGSRALAVAALAALTVGGLRGSLGRRPLQEKDLATTGDAVLNELVPNPVLALYLAVRHELRLQSDAGIQSFLPDGDVRGAARALFPERGAAADLDQSLARVAPGARGPRAEHVFVVVMESYDAWPLEPKYASLHLSDRLAELGRSGIAVRAFVPAGSGTIKSLGAIVTGLPSTGLFVSHEPVLRGGVPTAAARIFRGLGYRTRFFYGGYLSWERVGDFAREQGFDEVWGGDEMGAQAKGNEWGVDDDVLFHFVLAHTGAEPTFDVVMSTSYHPPYDVDLDAKGFPLAALRDNPRCRGLSDRQLRVLGHLWYSDQSLGDFVAAAEAQLARPLFALTGDHYSRETSVNPRPTLFESTAVPLVLHGPEVLAGVKPPPALAGAHVDIVPTLVDLVAPAGFAYPAFGRDLLDGARPQIGYGDDAVVAPGFIFRVRDPGRVETLDGGLPATHVPSAELALHYRQLHGLSWWRTHAGSAWP